MLAKFKKLYLLQQLPQTIKALNIFNFLSSYLAKKYSAGIWQLCSLKVSPLLWNRGKCELCPISFIHRGILVSNILWNEMKNYREDTKWLDSLKKNQFPWGKKKTVWKSKLRTHKNLPHTEIRWLKLWSAPNKLFDLKDAFQKQFLEASSIDFGACLLDGE